MNPYEPVKMATVFEETVKIPKTTADWLNHICSDEPKDEDDFYDNYLSEDNTYTVTIKFSNGIEMDVKCCGVQYQEDGANTMWTEAVLFDHGSEICCTDPSDEFIGDWELEDDNNKYIAHVIIE